MESSRVLSFKEASAWPRTRDDVRRCSPGPRDTPKVYLPRIACDGSEVRSTYSLLDTGSTHSFIAQSISRGYSSARAGSQVFRALGSTVTPRRMVTVPFLTPTSVVTVTCGVLPDADLPRYCRLLLAQYDYKKVSRGCC